MGSQYQLEFDGQSVTQDDYNALAEVAALSDDKVFAELFRLTPYDGTVARGIIPYAHASSSSTLIAPNGASGSIKVNPFRAIIGTRTAEGTDAALCWQDTRSAISVADGATTLATIVALSANASGNPRWDAIYSAVTIDTLSTPTTRKVKNPGSGVVTDESVSIRKYVSIVVSVAAGTPGASPAFPAIPSDAANTYYILLGYIRVPTGFTGSSTVATKDVNTVAPLISISRAMGVSTLQPANGNFKTGGDGISGSGTSLANGIGAWTGTTATRPGAYIPPTMQGQESRIIAIDMAHTTTQANWSHQDGDIIDDSIDWRGRLFKWFAAIGKTDSADGTATFPWNTTASTGLAYGGFSIPAPNIDTSGIAYQSGFAHSIGTTDLAVVSLYDSNVPNTIMNSGSALVIKVDNATGALRVYVASTPEISVIIWLEATAPYENY